MSDGRTVGRRPAKPRTSLCELRYQAETRDKLRRVVPPVKARMGRTPLERFLLVASLRWTGKLHHEVPAQDRERGEAEGHMGELKDVLAPAFADTNGA